ncbi:nucleoside monophosphate kinase [Candidatus Pacearchaeota archaeon]|jgi:adenylate kinase family enzyme|nr:nucleoside monophosphate kinase [Candidatus Pacearchaeota archaeon]
MEKILFTGAPGAGKGTQSKLLIPYGFQHISTGDLIRNTKDTEILSYLEKIGKGGFLPDKLIFKLIEKSIGNKNYILDGAVRTLAQAEYVKEKELVDKVFFLYAERKTCINRLLNRNQGRTDDNIEIIKKRFNKYYRDTFPTLRYLKDNFDFYSINGEKPIEEINYEIMDILDL